MPIQSRMQSLGARRGKQYTEIGRFSWCLNLIVSLPVPTLTLVYRISIACCVVCRLLAFLASVVAKMTRAGSWDSSQWFQMPKALITSSWKP